MSRIVNSALQVDLDESLNPGVGADLGRVGVRPAQAALQIGAEPGHAALGEQILQAGVLAVAAVALVSVVLQKSYRGLRGAVAAAVPSLVALVHCPPA